MSTEGQKEAGRRIFPTGPACVCVRVRPLVLSLHLALLLAWNMSAESHEKHAHTLTRARASTQHAHLRTTCPVLTFQKNPVNSVEGENQITLEIHPVFLVFLCFLLAPVLAPISPLRLAAGTSNRTGRLCQLSRWTWECVFCASPGNGVNTADFKTRGLFCFSKRIGSRSTGK